MEIKNLPLSSVLPSLMNPRKTFNEEDLRELADNIERQGLLQPITVRPVRHPNNEYGDRPDKYEIVCGERRYRACALLGEKWKGFDKVAPGNRFETIAAIVREMTDEEAFDAMITENLQRKDVDPMEEAFAFGQLIEKGNSVADIAARFGKSVRFVQDRVKLNSLIPELMVAVKEDKMSISAAMIIAKLTEEEQRKYANSYGTMINGYNKSSAESFINSLFMTIDRSPWYKAGDEDFADGCACKCSECEFNTANHGCLFWEMKGEDAGKCTNRERFDKKQVAFVLNKLLSYGDKLVKKGQPLESGKMVILDENEYCTPRTKELKKLVYKQINFLDYEVVKPEGIFAGKCFYNDDDERLKEKIESGEVYPCLHIFEYDNLVVKPNYWYIANKVAEGEDQETPAASKQSLDAMKLVQKRNGIKEKARLEMTSRLMAMATDMGKVAKDGALTENGQLAFDVILFTLCGNEFLKKYGYEEYGKPLKFSLIDVIKKNRNDCKMWARELIRNIISGGETCYNELYQYCAELVLKEWKHEEYEQIVKEIASKLAEDLKKNEEKLNALGYGADGKLLEEAPEIEDEKQEPSEAPAKEPKVERLPKSSTPWENFESLKEKHPNAILLFRVGDFYEAFDRDAEDLAQILGITLTSRSIGGEKRSLAGFPHHAIDAYLPKIIRAGRRVAICDDIKQQES